MPIPVGYEGPRAKISDTSTPVSSTKIQFFQLAKVDGREVQTSSASTYVRNRGHGFAMDPKVESREVPARQSILRIEGVTHVAADILAFGGGMYHVEGEVSVSLDADKTYFVKGILAKEYSAVWVEDATGKLVSTKIEKGVKP
jgi:hypothetical protein